ncbi:LLLL and CFNLAS motif-containing protein 1-like [Lacerta agilis]|uniref:LLLL and CFNLAS motif-containing protein 1-like n=1 Tax=Lacerta agilis TaxID=80427 RepID=UPI00141A1CBE|nr:LLLL and CFNLAS motif-containing protein 1-like [Lacerta agilis]
MVSLEGTIGLLAVLFTTHFLVYSDGFISQAVLQASMDKRQGGGGGKMEETFMASSTGEGMEVIDMAESEDSQLLGNAAVKDMLLDLAVSLNTASVMLFFLCVT